MTRIQIILTLFIVSLLILILAPVMGMTSIPLDKMLQPSGQETESIIFWQIRIPRVMAAFLSGAGLAVCGLVFQAIFRTPLATPFTLGVASGASLGAVFYIQAGLSLMLLGVPGIVLFAFLGAVLTILAVYAVARYSQMMLIHTMLLAGIAINFFCSSLILFFQYISDFTESYQIMHWLMGGLDGADFHSVVSLAPFVILGSLALMFFSNELNLMRTGEELAISRGVDLRKTNLIFFAITSLMVGSIVSNWGPIGFIGIIVPQICRLWIGADHRYLVPTVFFTGGIFLTLCDTVARLLIAPVEIPVSVITALIGGPFFLWILIQWNTAKKTA